MLKMIMVTILMVVLTACSSPKRTDELTHTNRMPYHDQEAYQLEQLGYGPHNPNMDIAQARRIRDQNIEESERSPDSFFGMLLEIFVFN